MKIGKYRIRVLKKTSIGNLISNDHYHSETKCIVEKLCVHNPMDRERESTLHNQSEFIIHFYEDGYIDCQTSFLSQIFKHFKVTNWEPPRPNYTSLSF